MSYSGSPTRYQEPPIHNSPSKKYNTSQTRWNWWYSAIADCMIAHPDWKLRDIAIHLNKHPSTISMITGSDLFRDFFAQRKAAWRDDHDLALRTRLTGVATSALDIVLEQLKTKGTQVPLQTALKVVESSLDRLGYAPSSGPGVVINNSQNDNRQQVLALSAQDLEAARAAMRLAEQAKIGSSLAPLAAASPTVLEACEVGQDVKVIDVEASTAITEGLR